jgi:hypothetical protein
VTANDPNSKRSDAASVTPFGLVWDVMTSPLTFMLNVSALGLLIALGTYVGQGLTESEMLSERTFAGTRALLGLGLNDLPTSWLVWLMALLTGLNVLGLVLRHIGLTPPGQRPWEGPGVGHTRWSDPRTMDEVRGALQTTLGRATQRGPTLVARRGYWLEGLTILGVGTLCLLSALVVDASSGMQARLGVSGGGPAQASDAAPTLAVTVLEDGTWIERQLPFTARCVETALADPRRGWRCTLSRTVPGPPGAAPVLDEVSLDLGPQWPADAFGLTFHVATERPTPGQPGRLRIVDRSSDADRLVYSGPSAGTTTLPDGHTLTAFTGPDGPLVVIHPPDAPSYLLTPAMDAGAAPAQVGGAALAAVSPWWLTLRASRRPGAPLLWTGLGLLLLGLLVLLAPAQVTVVAEPGDHGVSLRAWSFNRLDAPEKLRAALVAHTHGGGG